MVFAADGAIESELEPLQLRRRLLVFLVVVVVRLVVRHGDDDRSECLILFFVVAGILWDSLSLGGGDRVGDRHHHILF